MRHTQRYAASVPDASGEFSVEHTMFIKTTHQQNKNQTKLKKKTNMKVKKKKRRNRKIPFRDRFTVSVSLPRERTDLYRGSLRKENGELFVGSPHQPGSFIGPYYIVS